MSVGSSEPERLSFWRRIWTRLTALYLLELGHAYLITPSFILRGRVWRLGDEYRRTHGRPPPPVRLRRPRT